MVASTAFSFEGGVIVNRGIARLVGPKGKLPYSECLITLIIVVTIIY